MKLAFLASVTVLALAYVTPVVADVPDACLVGKDSAYCPAHSAPATHVDRNYAARFLAARAAHRLHAHAQIHAHAKVAVHPAVSPDSSAVRVATLEDRRAASSCEGSSISVLCPGYQLLGIAY